MDATGRRKTAHTIGDWGLRLEFAPSAIKNPREGTFLHRRQLLELGIVAPFASLVPRAAIDRRALARRHNPVLTGPDPASPCQIGNGEFAITVDITGLQTFP
jgi:hypothetical protein